MFGAVPREWPRPFTMIGLGLLLLLPIAVLLPWEFWSRTELGYYLERTILIGRGDGPEAETNFLLMFSFVVICYMAGEIVSAFSFSLFSGLVGWSDTIRDVNRGALRESAAHRDLQKTYETRVEIFLSVALSLPLVFGVFVVFALADGWPANLWLANLLALAISAILPLRAANQAVRRMRLEHGLDAPTPPYGQGPSLP